MDLLLWTRAKKIIYKAEAHLLSGKEKVLSTDQFGLI